MTKIESIGALREKYRAPSERVRRKAITALDAHCRTFIAHSPFLVIGTAGASEDGKAGGGDVSPRGDGPGFVHVLDDTTILIPDRKGNNRLDTLANIVENPEVAIIFMIPGFDETLRVNGRASLSDDPALLEHLSMGGKPALMAIRVEIVEAYLADPTDLAWTKFHQAYLAVVEDRFLVEKARFDELAALATEQDVYLGCNCPTKKNPIVGRCHTYLALEFMQQKYPTLGVSCPIFGTVSAQLPARVCVTMAPVQPLDTRSSLGNQIAGLTPKQMGNRDTITSEGNLHER